MMATARQTDTVRLASLLAGNARVPPALDRAVSGLSQDSRTVEPGGVFFARDGARVDGAMFAGEAAARGACAMVLAGDGPVAGAAHGMLRVPVSSVTRTAGMAAHRFFGAPTEALALVAITGTNGKTSVGQFVAQAMERHYGAPVGELGTLGQCIAGVRREGALTTPDCIAVHRAMADFRDAGARLAVMEASSHALAQDRLAGLAVHTAVFTNLSRDHLDYHGDMRRYAEAKARLFAMPGLRAAVLNAEDPATPTIRARLDASVPTVHFAMDRRLGATFTASMGDADGEGVDLVVDGEGGRQRIRSRLIGLPAAWNLLTAYAVLHVHGVSAADAARLLSEASPVPGRMQPLRARGAPLVVVDYAHTPAALAASLSALRALCRGRLWCVFGAGGERDPGKRPLMGEAAAALADVLVITDDNPRAEDGERIVEQIVAGVPAAKRDSLRRERDRARAIGLAIARAAAEDVVLVAGKGHEDYQEVSGRRLPFSDMAAARAALTERAR
jgi:UDP-N-acetylmuramoyl-L-alanyl-D-glutamate--2,6-diaminopimelate ligase